MARNLVNSILETMPLLQLIFSLWVGEGRWRHIVVDPNGGTGEIDPESKNPFKVAAVRESNNDFLFEVREPSVADVDKLCTLNPLSDGSYVLNVSAN